MRLNYKVSLQIWIKNHIQEFLFEKFICNVNNLNFVKHVFVSEMKNLSWTNYKV